MDTNLRDEYLDLLAWFDIKYTQKEQKYRRLYTLKQQCDDGSSPYDKLMELYKEAEIKRKRIQEIEGLINE